MPERLFRLRLHQKKNRVIVQLKKKNIIFPAFRNHPVRPDTDLNFSDMRFPEKVHAQP